MRLVQHIGRREARRLPIRGLHQLVEDQEQPIGLDRARIQVVIAIFRIVEVEAGELSRMQQARDDHLDIHIRRVMAEIDQAEAALAHRLRRQQGTSPNPGSPSRRKAGSYILCSRNSRKSSGMPA